VGAGNFSLLHRVQTCSGVYPAFYPMGNGGSFPGLKRPGREPGHSLPPSVHIKNAWSYISTPQSVFMARPSVKAQGQLYLYLKFPCFIITTRIIIINLFISSTNLNVLSIQQTYAIHRLRNILLFCSEGLVAR